MNKPQYKTEDKVRRKLSEVAYEVCQIIWKDDREEWLYRLNSKTSGVSYATENELRRWYPSDSIEVAEALHDKLCHQNHTDGCGWMYGDWEKKPLRDSRVRYLSKAKSVLKVTDKQTILAILERI